MVLEGVRDGRNLHFQSLRVSIRSLNLELVVKEFQCLHLLILGRFLMYSRDACMIYQLISRPCIGLSERSSMRCIRRLDILEVWLIG